MTDAPRGLVALQSEIARQRVDALASFQAAAPRAAAAAAAIRRTGRVLFLGMGASHAVASAVEPIYRAEGIDAIAVPLSEQLDRPLPLDGRAVVVTSQSGESAEVLRWCAEVLPRGEVFGLTLDGGSALGRAMPCLVGAGGVETAFAATRSALVTLALHAAILAALGADPGPMLSTLAVDAVPDVSAAVEAVSGVTAVAVTGRQLQGLAEALALGLAELARVPAFALEGGQFRHGPLEMLGPKLGVVLFRAADPTGDAMRRLAETVVQAGSPTVVLDASGEAPANGVTTLAVERAEGLAALAALMPLAQRLMVAFAAARVADVGTPVRSAKVTRDE